jgi:hypothetical protein
VATLTIPQPAATKAHALSVRCTSNRRYAVVQLVPNNTKTHAGNYRPKVLFRSNNPSSVAVKVRQLGGYSFVFDNVTGELIWSNTSSEWLGAESAILNHRDRGGLK